MVEYLPWSKKVLQDVVNDVSQGYFSILDLELGGECNCNCIYCDSPDRSEKVLYSVEMIEEFIKDRRIKWLFICGLGEPTFNQNYDILLKLLKICEKKMMKCSIFTNATNITKDLKHYIYNGVLYVLFKYDSFYDEISNKIIGKNCIDSYNEIFVDMAKMVKINEDCSNIAASIVPTIYNEDILVELARKCLENNIFPLIGSLENAGKAQNSYEMLAIKKEKLLILKSQIEQYLGEEYKLPICPSTVGAIHVTNKGEIVLDSRSGLSCSWFWMETPCMITIGKISEQNAYDKACERILEYREGVKNNMKNVTNNCVDKVFGGCGGNFEELLSIVSGKQ